MNRFRGTFLACGAAVVSALALSYSAVAQADESRAECYELADCSYDACVEYSWDLGDFDNSHCENRYYEALTSCHDLFPQPEAAPAPPDASTPSVPRPPDEYKGEWNPYAIKTTV